jgi:tetratricopeptide (TPR) repeat protein
MGLECAGKLPDGGGALHNRVFQLAHTMALDPREAILADDRSGLFEAMVDDLDERKHPAEAHEVAAAWAAFLEGEAAHAKTPDARAVFDPHRMGAYLALGTPERALPMLEQSARDFPHDYNPPARIARVYFEMHRWAEARTAIDQALALAYGPRRLRLCSLKADILVAEGDPHGAAAVLRAAVAEGRSMSLPGSYAKLVTSLEERARTLETSSGTPAVR